MHKCLTRTALLPVTLLLLALWLNRRRSRLASLAAARKQSAGGHSTVFHATPEANAASFPAAAVGERVGAKVVRFSETVSYIVVPDARLHQETDTA